MQSSFLLFSVDEQLDDGHKKYRTKSFDARMYTCMHAVLCVNKKTITQGRKSKRTDSVKALRSLQPTTLAGFFDLFF